MTQNRMPWVKWSFADWSRDPCLRACSPAARGIWMDMLCAMDASPERGFLVVGARAASNAEIARIIGCERRLMERVIEELERNGVFSRDDRGAIFSRRMTRDGADLQRDVANGKRGGNPVLLKNKEVAEIGVNPPVKADIDKEEEIEEEKKKEPPINPPAPAARPDARGARLSPDWRPSAADREFALDKGLDPEAIAASFSDYWHSKPGAGGRKLDWAATWREWCRNQRTRFPARSAQPASKLGWMLEEFGSKQSRPDPMTHMTLDLEPLPQ